MYSVNGSAWLVLWRLLVRLRFVERQRVFARRLFDEYGRLEAKGLRHVLDFREVAEIVETESNQELLRRGIQEWTADNFFSPHDLDQVTFEERVQDAGRVHAANLRHLEG